jgi:hypothetical protein
LRAVAEGATLECAEAVLAHLRLSLLIVIAVMSGAIIFASCSPANASALEVARAAFAKQDFALSVAKFQEAADQGDPEAMALLGTMYFYGIGVPYDREKAFALNLKAAVGGESGCPIPSRFWV